MVGQRRTRRPAVCVDEALVEDGNGYGLNVIARRRSQLSPLSVKSRLLRLLCSDNGLRPAQPRLALCKGSTELLYSAPCFREAIRKLRLALCCRVVDGEPGD